MRKFLLTILLSCVFVSTFGQSGRLIYGCVYGEDKQPLSGARISTVYGDLLCVTDEFGKFQIHSQSYVDKIVVSYDEYLPKQIKLDGSYRVIRLMKAVVPDNRTVIHAIKPDIFPHLSLEYTIGVKPIDRFEVGVGVGLGWDWYERQACFMPIYLQSKYYITEKRVSPFVLASYGSYLALDSMKWAPLAELGVGVDYKINSKNSIFVSATAKMIPARYEGDWRYMEYEPYGDTILLCNIQVGFTF